MDFNQLVDEAQKRAQARQVYYSEAGASAIPVQPQSKVQTDYIPVNIRQELQPKTNLGKVAKKKSSGIRFDDFLGSIGGMVIGAAMWFFGGLNFYSTAKGFGLNPNGVWLIIPGLLYIVITYLEMKMLPDDFSEIFNKPWYIWLLWSGIVLLDVGGVANGLLQIMGGIHLPIFGGIDLAKNSPIVFALSLFLGIGIAFGAEPILRYFFNEAKKAVSR